MDDAPDNVVNLSDLRPHWQVLIECPECAHAWRAVFPEKTRRLECPACGKAFALVLVSVHG